MVLSSYYNSIESDMRESGKRPTNIRDCGADVKFSDPVVMVVLIGLWNATMSTEGYRITNFVVFLILIELRTRMRAASPMIGFRERHSAR